MFLNYLPSEMVEVIGLTIIFVFLFGTILTLLFTSDHGNCLGIHDKISKNNHYEESMRVPFLIRWPEHIQPRIDDLLISTPDFAPTLLGLMGFDEDIPPETDGIDYSSLFLTGDVRGSYCWCRSG